MCCSFVCDCSKCMDDCLPPGGATTQSPRYVIFFVLPWQRSLHAHTLQSTASSGCECLVRLVPSCTTLLRAICHLDSRSAEVKYIRSSWTPGKGEKERQGGNYTHTHGVHLHCDKDVYCTFVSRTDIIRSLASLTFSLFPHTLMCGSAGEKKSVFNVCVCTFSSVWMSQRW